MNGLIRLAFRCALPLLCALFLGVPVQGQAEPGAQQDWTLAENLVELTEILEVWLDQNAPWPRRDTAPEIRQIGAARAYSLADRTAKYDSNLRGFYDPAARTVYLVRPWSLRDPQDVGVLLHELVHHRQHTGQHWYCPGAQELPAYKMQEAWLNEQNQTGQINWIAAVLEAGCTPRDIHPD